jgi:peptide/nickel transport system substrate-binding protein
MRLFPNLAARGETDAQSAPHPALADVRVRKAIRAAIDVDTIIKEIWYGLSKPVSTEFFRPPYKCEVAAPVYDPQAAGALLDEAGWKDQDGDGVRECHGCQNASEGDPLAFELATYSEFGNELELTQQLIAEMLGKVGMKVELAMYEGSVVWADTAGGGLEQNGNFDLDLWDDGYPGIDPTDYLRYLYHSESAEPDAGWNVMRWKNAQFDALLDESYTLDEAKRKQLFCQMATILADELPVIPLFTVMDADAHSSRLQGVQSSVNDLVTWNVADWTLAK